MQKKKRVMSQSPLKISSVIRYDLSSLRPQDSISLQKQIAEDTLQMKLLVIGLNLEGYPSANRSYYHGAALFRTARCV